MLSEEIVVQRRTIGREIFIACLIPTRLPRLTKLLLSGILLLPNNTLETYKCFPWRKDREDAQDVSRHRQTSNNRAANERTRWRQQCGGVDVGFGVGVGVGGSGSGSGEDGSIGRSELASLVYRFVSRSTISSNCSATGLGRIFHRRSDPATRSPSSVGRFAVSC